MTVFRTLDRFRLFFRKSMVLLLYDTMKKQMLSRLFFVTFRFSAPLFICVCADDELFLREQTPVIQYVMRGIGG